MKEKPLLLLKGNGFSIVRHMQGVLNILPYAFRRLVLTVFTGIWIRKTRMRNL